MVSGRKKTFEFSQLLASSTLLFWEKGFQNTSMREAAQALGLTTGSLYNEFGGKEAMFASIVRHYTETVIKPRVENILLAENPSFSSESITALARLQYFLISSIDHSHSNKIPKSCLLVNSQIEFSGQSNDFPEVKQEIENGQRYIQKAVLKLIKQAQSDLEIDPELNAKDLLNQFSIFMTGLLTLSKSIQKPRSLITAVEQFIRQLHFQTQSITTKKAKAH